MAMTMVGTQAPQKLFGDLPAATSQIPGMVTPQITAGDAEYGGLGCGSSSAECPEGEQGDWACGCD